ncbi:hypothetical protein AYI69_g9199, partial [Smittium culicis]
INSQLCTAHTPRGIQARPAPSSVTASAPIYSVLPPPSNTHVPVYATASAPATCAVPVFSPAPVHSFSFAPAAIAVPYFAPAPVFTPATTPVPVPSALPVFFSADPESVDSASPIPIPVPASSITTVNSIFEAQTPVSSTPVNKFSFSQPATNSETAPPSHQTNI